MNPSSNVRLYLQDCLAKYNKLPVQVRASFWFFICAFLQKAVGMISTPIFTRLLTPAEYGQFNVFTSWMGIVAILISLCLGAGVYMQGLVKFDKKRALFSSSMQGLTLGLVIVWSIVYALGHAFWNQLFSLTTLQMTCMFMLIWVSAVFNFWASEQRVDYKYRTLVIVTLIASFLQPLIGILFVLASSDKVTARILGLVVVDTACFSWMFFKQMHSGNYKISWSFCKYALMFNIPLVPHYLSQVVLSSSDRIMIGQMVGDSQAGIYSLAYSVALIMTLFNTALCQTISPWIYQQIKRKRIERLAPVIYFTLILIAGVNLFLMLCAPEIIAIFAPKPYYRAIWTIPPVAMSVYLMYAYDAFAKFAFYFEKTGYIMVASVVGAIANILLNYWLIPIFGYIVAGYTTWLCYVLYVTFHYLFMNKICDTYCQHIRPYNSRIILIITGVFFISSFLILLTYQCMWLRYSLIGCFGIAFWFVRKKIWQFIQQIKNLRDTTYYSKARQ